jgi:HAD superfamily phosphoserine phosphatase-like hydrolase
VFDLDGTVTKQELLPLIASALNLEKEMKLLTKLTLDGTIPFEDSFRLRVAILKTAPLKTIQEIVSEVKIDPNIETFIFSNKDKCYLATGNLDVWISPLIDKLGCKAFTSIGIVKDGKLIGVSSVLRKNIPVLSLRNTYDRIVAIGESANDMPLFDAADIRVAFGGVHPPTVQIVEMADYVVFNGDSLCRLLSTL